MAWARRSAWLSGALLAWAAGTAFALAAFDGVQAGWQPLVQLGGRGDPALAVQTLTRWTGAYGTVLNHTDIDQPTQRFVDEALEQLSDFDLKGFHQLLPEQRDGFRELWVRGELTGGRYAIRRASNGAAARVSLHGPRRGLWDMSQTVRAKLNESRDGEERSYLLGLRAGVGIGKLSWDTMVAAGKDFARMIASADPRAGAGSERPAAAQEAQQSVRKLHPKLAAEDVASVALLFDAYPATSRALSQLGQLENVRDADGGKGYQHLVVSARGSTERLSERHAKLARHLRKLGKIARFDLRWLDAKQRTLMKLFVDSESLVIRTECYVKDGQLLPFAGKTVFADEPIDLLGDSLKRSRLTLDGRFQLLGVVVKMRNLKVDLSLTPHGSHAEVLARLTSMPEVEIDGAALGFVPTGLIDAFIPGNMRSLTLDFFRVATTGNQGKGVAIALSVGAEQSGGDGVIEASVDLEALDNRLVKMGVAMVNDRMVPDDDVSADDKALASEIHAAFVKDLARYRARVQAAPQPSGAAAGAAAGGP